MSKTDSVTVKIVGIGGTGCNVIKRLVADQLRGAEFIAMDTDVRYLGIKEARQCIMLGNRLPNDHEGTSGDHVLGRQCAEENLNEIKQAIEGADMVLLVASMGGGTGIGAIPVVAEIAKQSGVLTIALVAKPWFFEGKLRGQMAEEGLNQLVNKVDALSYIQLDDYGLADFPSSEAAFKANERNLCEQVQAMVELVTGPGLINVNFADIKAVLREAGTVGIVVGRDSFGNGAAATARNALSCEYVSKEQWLICSVTKGFRLSLFDLEDIIIQINRYVSPKTVVTLRIGVVANKGDPSLRVTVIAPRQVYPKTEFSPPKTLFRPKH